MEILEGLNPEQLQAVKHDLGPQLVIAGAGTGKTQVITRRIAYLIAQGKAKPSEILALTFTEKAAREMQSRLYELIGWESFQVPVSTFHAFGTELLGRFAGHIGRSIGGGLITDAQKTLLLKRHIDRITLGYFGSQDNLYEFLVGMVEYIGNLQNAGITATAYSNYVAELKLDPNGMHPMDIDEQADISRIYTLYEEIKIETGTYDHNDQLNIPLEILKSRPNLADRLKREYKYVMVDEYQDTNAVQDALLKTFIGSQGNIFAVGDDDQAIYGFRGAEINNILAFAEYFDVPKPTVLIRNYRSGQAILDAAYKLIQHNNPARLEEKLSLDKRLLALHNDSKVVYRPYLTSQDEQDCVITAIQAQIDSGESPSAISILAATHAPLKVFAKAMAKLGIPYAISSTVSIFDQPELLALWSLLKWIDNQSTDEAIGYLVLGTFFKWSSEEYRQILEQSRQDMTTIEETMRNSDNSKAQILMSLVDTWRVWANELTASQLAFRLIFDTGLAERWQKQASTSPRMIRVFEDLYRFLNSIQDFEAVALSSDLNSYLEAFPNPPVLEVSEPTGDEEGVQLLSVHAAKGLEFDTVYLIGVTQRSWSSRRGAGRDLPTNLKPENVMPPDHEFRRLMYVAVTRARNQLFISAPTKTAGGIKQMISPFVTEMFGDVNAEVSLASKNEDKQPNMLNKLQRFYPLQTLYHSDKLPFETQDGWLELSVTSLGGYEFCPFEFYVQHVLKVVSPMGPELDFGNLLHKLFELYNKSLIAGENLAAGELHKVLDDNWKSQVYANPTRAEADRVLAHKTLDNFLLRDKDLQRIILGSEVPIRYEIPEAKLRLRGKIDALFESLEGVEIRDYKTGRTKTDVEKLAKLAKDNFQLRTYALAYQQLRGKQPALVVLDYVVTSVEGKASLSPKILANHRDKLINMAAKIRSRDFAPNTSSLHVCAAARYYGKGEEEELNEYKRNNEGGRE